MPMHLRLVIISLLLTVPRLAWSADEPATKPSPAKATDEAPAAKPAAAPGPKQAEFARVMGEWKDLLTKLENLRIQYRTADEKKRTEMQQQWKLLMGQATTLQEQLITTAQNAYREAPNANAQVTELLVALLNDWVQHDDYEKAFPIGKLLMDNKCPEKAVAGLAGMAAYCVQECDLAEAWLTEAQKTSPLPPEVQAMLAGVAYTKEAWAKEQKIRQAEAKADDLPRVLLKTSEGDIELELFENEAPNSVANFIALVDKGYYNGLTFHRVLKGFMAQGGCPKGDGTGDPGYKIPAEFTSPKHRNHFRGSLAMARSQDPDSAGSQFYLMFAPNRSLDGNYTVFGRVVKGSDVLAKIRRIDPQDTRSTADPDKIVEAKVLRKRPGSKYEVKKVE